MSAEERDQLVETVVFGKKFPTRQEMIDEAKRVLKEQPSCGNFWSLGGFSAWRKDDGTWEVNPNCAKRTTSIAAAFEVLPKIPDGVQITCYGSRFKVQNLGMSGAPFIGQDNLPELICLAALRASNVEVE